MSELEKQKLEWGQSIVMGNFRLTPEQAQLFREAQEASGLNYSDFLRAIVAAYLDRRNGVESNG